MQPFRVGKLGNPVDLGLVEPHTYRSGRELRCQACGQLNEVPLGRRAWRCAAQHGDRRCNAVHRGGELDPLYLT